MRLNQRGHVVLAKICDILWKSTPLQKPHQHVLTALVERSVARSLDRIRGWIAIRNEATDLRVGAGIGEGSCKLGRNLSAFSFNTDETPPTVRALPDGPSAPGYHQDCR